MQNCEHTPLKNIKTDDKNGSVLTEFTYLPRETAIRLWHRSEIIRGEDKGKHFIIPTKGFLI